jgi:hypothetical protein
MNNIVLKVTGVKLVIKHIVTMTEIRIIFKLQLI